MYFKPGRETILVQFSGNYRFAFHVLSEFARHVGLGLNGEIADSTIYGIGQTASLLYGIGLINIGEFSKISLVNYSEEALLLKRFVNASLLLESVG